MEAWRLVCPFCDESIACNSSRRESRTIVTYMLSQVLD